MEPKLVIRYVFREAVGIIGMAVALFWSAGTLGWWAAWGSIAVMVGWIVATAIHIFRCNPDLLQERLGPRMGAQPWDAAIVSILGLIQLIRYIIAGLDQRYGWTPSFPQAAQLVGLAACILGYSVFVWATASNPFFSQVVRIQSERHHTVISGGPYHYVRHPAYAGAFLYELAVPILLASWPAMIVSLLSAGLLVFRTLLEDRFLENELKSYDDYKRRVRFRLLPGIW